jgi:hypothetical protein
VEAARGHEGTRRRNDAILSGKGSSILVPRFFDFGARTNDLADGGSSLPESPTVIGGADSIPTVGGSLLPESPVLQIRLLLAGISYCYVFVASRHHPPLFFFSSLLVRIGSGLLRADI